MSGIATARIVLLYTCVIKLFTIYNPSDFVQWGCSYFEDNMAVYIGRYNGVPEFSMGTDSSKLHSNPPDPTLLFRSDLPYILADEYVVSAYTDTSTSAGTVRYFSLPTEVISAMGALHPVLFYWVNGSNVVACTPQLSYYSWYGSTWGYIKARGVYVNKNFFFINPSFAGSNGTNWSTFSKDAQPGSDASVATLYANNDVMLKSGVSTIGFPLFTSRSFTPLQLKCVVLNNITYTSSTNPLLNRSSVIPNTTQGIKISRTEFTINGVDFRTKKLLVYSNKDKPTNGLATTGISSNITSLYPGASTYTSDKLFSTTQIEYRRDSSGAHEKFTLSPSQFSTLSGLIDNGTSVTGLNGYNNFRSTFKETLTDFKTPIFGIMQPQSTSSSVEIISSTPAIKFGGVDFISPSVVPLMISPNTGVSYTYSGGTVSKTVTSDTSSILTDGLISSISNVFDNIGCGLLTIYSPSQMDLNHNTYVVNSSNNASIWGLKNPLCSTTNYTYMHSCLTQLSSGEKLPLFTVNIATANLEPYVWGGSGGCALLVYIKRNLTNLEVRYRLDNGGIPFYGSTSYGTVGNFTLKFSIPSFSFSFMELL